jgi:phenylalanyl-tRNA synthetase beta chain
MKISYNWLKEHIQLDYEPEYISKILTDIGLEVESVEKIETIKGGLRGVVIGKVLTCEKHPDADKLSVTTVDTGEGKILPIVCGAPNVAKGQKVVVATVGTILFAGEKPFEIKKAKIRGQESEGMICAEDELGLGVSHDGIMVLPEDAETGMPASEYFNIEEDHVFEIGLTPNRNDAMSHVGVARDLAAALNFKDANNALKVFTACTDVFKVENNDLPIGIIVEDTEACPRYTGVTISGVKVAESPDWLKNKLLAIGLRPINNLVDISNFVLHETGHPTHFFDADKIRGEKVIIKKLPKGSKFITLDEVERELNGEELMICDEAGGMCMAGIFGGLDSGVSENTKNIFIESAYFDPKTIRKAAKYHGLNTDSSFRFERGVNPNATRYVLRRAALLVKQLAGGTVSSEVQDIYPNRIEPQTIDVTYANIHRLTGYPIEPEQIKDILLFLQIEILEETEDGMKLQIPTFKSDVTREADVVEEILRIYGYNNIPFPAQIRTSPSYIEKPDREQVQDLISNYLSNNGFYEIINNSLTKVAYSDQFGFINKNTEVNIFNPLSNDLGALRQTLITSGLESIVYNLNRKNADLQLYEFGKTYALRKNPAGKKVPDLYEETQHLALFITGSVNKESWYDPQKESDFFALKSSVLKILTKLNIDEKIFQYSVIADELFESAAQYSQNDRPVVILGKLSSRVLSKFDIKKPVFYAGFNWDLIIQILKNHQIVFKPVAKFPEVRRDLALLIDRQIEFEELKRLAFKTEKSILKEVNLFDVYQGDKIEKGKKSYALSFLLQDETKTLTDKVIEKTMNKIAGAYKFQLGAVIR